MNKYPKHRADAENKWKILAENWMLAPPPAAPSDNDIENYFYDSRSDSTRVLVLGVTPALREASNTRAMTHFALDCTPEMIRVSNVLLPAKLRPFALLGDWLDMPFVRDSFDLVVGDKILGNLMPELWSDFFREVERVLDFGGEFRTRATPNGTGHLQRWGEENFFSAVKKWARKIGEIGVNQAVASLWEDRMNSSIHSTDGKFGTQSLIKGLPQANRDAFEEQCGDQNERLLVREFLSTYWETRDLVWSAYCDEAVVKSETAALKFVKREFASDYDAGVHQPCYVFRKDN